MLAGVALIILLIPLHGAVTLKMQALQVSVLEGEPRGLKEDDIITLTILIPSSLTALARGF